MPLSSNTKARIMNAGLDLFYAGSIAETGVDAIASRAGVTKKTVYHHYASKEVLVAACYVARAKLTLARYQLWAAPPGNAATRMARMFENVRAYVDAPDFHGCGFLRAAAELAAQREHMAAASISGYKNAMEGWIADMLREEGQDRPEGKARAVIMLLDGALAHVMFHRDPSYLEEAGRAVQVVLRG